MKKIYISENEKINILKSHQSSNFIDEVVITDWLSPDERYCIFLDELYDIKNKIRIGNIWENFDNFKMFLKHSFEVSTTITEEIRESVLNQINSLVLTESSNNMTMLKPFVKQFLNEESNASKMWNDFTTWGKETVSGAVKGVKDFAKTSWEGIKKTYSYIKDGDWKKMRTWVVNNIDNDPQTIFRKLYDTLTDHVTQVPQLILLLADYQYKAAFCADQEINLVACLTEIMAAVEFK